MNSDTQETAEQCAKDAGAIIKCPACFGHYVSADDLEAESRAFATATEVWKSGERGFRNMDRDEVMEIVKSALTDANISCPSCGN